MIIEPPKKVEFASINIVSNPSSKEHEWLIKQYLDVPNWICPTCGSTVFGRTLFCPFNQNKGPQCLTPKPKSTI